MVSGRPRTALMLQQFAQVWPQENSGKRAVELQRHIVYGRRYLQNAIIEAGSACRF